MSLTTAVKSHTRSHRGRAALWLGTRSETCTGLAALPSEGDASVRAWRCVNGGVETRQWEYDAFGSSRGRRMPPPACPQSAQQVQQREYVVVLRWVAVGVTKKACMRHSLLLRGEWSAAIASHAHSTVARWCCKRASRRRCGRAAASHITTHLGDVAHKLYHLGHSDERLECSQLEPERGSEVVPVPAAGTAADIFSTEAPPCLPAPPPPPYAV
jgi:hypothetical protein